MGNRRAAALGYVLLLAWCRVSAQQAANAPPAPSANPGRPTVSTPATLTPAGYFQFESGFLGAWHSPEFTSQSSFGEVIKFAPVSRVQFLASFQPVARSHVVGESQMNAGDISLGVQGVVYPGEGIRPTVSLSYFHRVYSGAAPNLDIGSASNSVLFLASADVKGFHYDTNYIFNEATSGAVRRAQFGQTLSISHSLPKKFGVSGEIWHFTQPFLRSNAVGSLWAVNYNLRPNLVLDGGFDRGLTDTSTRWEAFAGFTYLLPRKIHFR